MGPKLTPEIVFDGRRRYRKSALDVGYEVEREVAKVRIFKFDELPPESFKLLITGLRKHFPNARFWADTERQVCVFTSESDTKLVACMRAFCAGFASSL